MKIKDIYDKEKANADSIMLYKEGIFWHAYERSAWHFVKNIKKYKLLNKYVKCIKAHVVYLGFPDTVFDSVINSINLGDKSVVKHSDYVVIKGFPKQEDFKRWKIGMIEQVSTKTSNDVDFVSESNSLYYSIKSQTNLVELGLAEMVSEKNNTRDLIIQKIIDFPIANKTAIEAFVFLLDIKKELYGAL